MKKLFLFLSFNLFLLSFETNILDDTIYNYYNDYINDRNVKVINNKDYFENLKVTSKDVYSSKIKLIDKDTVNNHEELINMYYTIINKGYKNYTFYCSLDYTDCLSDIEKLDSDDAYFNLLNQLVSPFNSYESISSIYSSNFKIEITVNNRYTNEDIERINTEVDRLITTLKIDSYNSIYDKIKVFHDYLAEINKYDTVREQTKTSEYHSDTAIGAFFEGHAVCNGYADALQIFLDKIDVPNIKIANDTHVWNAIYLNNTWYHIDLTWDDPVTSDNSDIILYDYFMITTEELENKKTFEHDFNKEVYDFIN